MHPDMKEFNNTDYAKECAKDYRAFKEIANLAKGSDLMWAKVIHGFCKERMGFIDNIVNGKPRED